MIRPRLSRCLLAMLVSLLYLQESSAQKLTVVTNSGEITATRSAAGVIAVQGIPFAEPPVGDLRWKPPVPVKHWSGVRSGESFGPACMQRIHGTVLPWTPEFLTSNRVSEDCLYLNVWTPRTGAQAHLPVVVFIHGGAFQEGSGDIASYDGEHLASTGLVIVTINYRLGAFGFLALPELTAESSHHSSGNYGLLDQMAALDWVRQNISSLGGDPHRVTVWGQSAGAFSVNALIASPLAKGLFERAMADSGIGITDPLMGDLQSAEAKGKAFASEHHAASLQALRAMPAEQFLAGFGFSPNVDGWVLLDFPSVLSQKGLGNDVPVLTGYQANDGLLAMPAWTTMSDYKVVLHNLYGAKDGAFQALYPAKNVEEAKAILLGSSRDRDRVSMYLWASERTKSHSAPVFTYFFSRAIPWPEHPEFGAFHTGEIPYLFRNLDKLNRPWEAADRQLSLTASAYLKNFAATGNPNGPGLGPWPAVRKDDPSTMQLGVSSGPMPLASKARLQFWIEYFHSEDARHAPVF